MPYPARFSSDSARCAANNRKPAIATRIRISNPKNLAGPAGAYSQVARVKAGAEMLLGAAVVAALD